MEQALCGKAFVVGVAALVAVMLFAGMESIIDAAQATEPLQNGFHVRFILGVLQSDVFTLALPILCALPFTTAFVDDIKSGFIKQYLIRTSRRQYIRGKLVACALSGGLLLFVGIAIVFFLSFLAFTPVELAFTEGQTAEPFVVQLITKTFTLTLCGMLWSLVGFMFAALTMNRLMAYASPFILYYVLIILHERYFSWFYVLYPKEWLFPQAEWVLGNMGIVLLLLALMLVLCFGFALFAEKRLDNV
jgi:hypothetical protein